MRQSPASRGNQPVAKQPQAEQARDQQCRYMQDRIIRHCSSRLEDVAHRRRPTIGASSPVVSFDVATLAIRAGPLQYLESPCDDDRRILALLDPVAVAAGQQHCEGYDGQYAHALISRISATAF